MIRKQRLCHDSLFKSMETKNVIELSAFSENPSFKQFLEENTALLAGVVHQKVAIIGLDYMLILKSK